RWLFSHSDTPDRWWKVVLWWEIRRIPFNVFCAVYGAFCLAIFFVSILTSGHLQPGEDAVEPIALIFAPVVANILYTSGWVVGLAVRSTAPNVSQKVGLLLFKLGLAFSFVVISLPALTWGGFRLLQLLHVVKQWPVTAQGYQSPW